MTDQHLDVDPVCPFAWDNVVALSRFPGFAELKRSLREVAQLPALGVTSGQVGVEEDWRQGHRRQVED